MEYIDIATAASYAIESALASGDDAKACAIFHDIDDDDAFAIVASRFPSLRNYGPRGEWRGSYRNENGWTP